jgi:hypothetical protein
MMKENRMRFARIGSPKKDHVRLFDLLIGIRTTACTKDRRQTGDARGVSSTVAAIDVVAADHNAGELLCNKVQFVRCLRTAEKAKRCPSMLVDNGLQTPRREVHSFIPARGLSLNQRLGEPGIRLYLRH